jgi:hypothetical protein
MSDRVEQRARVLLEGAHLVEARRVCARRGEVERRHAVPRRPEQRGHLVPAPTRMSDGGGVRRDDSSARFRDDGMIGYIRCTKGPGARLSHHVKYMYFLEKSD